MVPYLHFAGGDYLYFTAWRPTSAGAIAGACIGLFLFAIFERWVAALRGVFEHHWKHRALLLSSKYSSRSEDIAQALEPSLKGKESSTSSHEQESLRVPSYLPRSPRRTIPPFVPSQDVLRGILYAFHAFLGYALMLAVMSYNAGYIISIVAGLGVGEVLFGRMTTGSAH